MKNAKTPETGITLHAQSDLYVDLPFPELSSFQEFKFNLYVNNYDISEPFHSALRMIILTEDRRNKPRGTGHDYEIHELGVWWLLRHFGQSEQQQLTGLVHDDPEHGGPHGIPLEKFAFTSLKRVALREPESGERLMVSSRFLSHYKQRRGMSAFGDPYIVLDDTRYRSASEGYINQLLQDEDATVVKDMDLHYNRDLRPVPRRLLEKKPGMKQKRPVWHEARKMIAHTIRNDEIIYLPKKDAAILIGLEDATMKQVAETRRRVEF